MSGHAVGQANFCKRCIGRSQGGRKLPGRGILLPILDRDHGVLHVIAAVARTVLDGGAIQSPLKVAHDPELSGDESRKALIGFCLMFEFARAGRQGIAPKQKSQQHEQQDGEESLAKRILWHGIVAPLLVFGQYG